MEGPTDAEVIVEFQDKIFVHNGLENGAKKYKIVVQTGKEKDECCLPEACSWVRAQPKPVDQTGSCGYVIKAGKTTCLRWWQRRPPNP